MKILGRIKKYLFLAIIQNSQNIKNGSKELVIGKLKD